MTDLRRRCKRCHVAKAQSEFTGTGKQMRAECNACRRKAWRDKHERLTGDEKLNLYQLRKHMTGQEQAARERVAATVRHLTADEIAAYERELLARDAASFRLPDEAPRIYVDRRKAGAWRRR